MNTNTNNIEQLKERATYSEEALNSFIERLKASYIPTESFYWTTPNAMLLGLQEAYKAGYTPCTELMHSVLPPSFYQVFLYKPEATQMADLYQITQHARQTYQQSVDEAKEQLFDALVEQEYLEEEAKAQAKAECAAQKKKEEIRKKLSKEFQ